MSRLTEILQGRESRREGEPRYEDVPLELIDSNSENVRRVCPKVRELADSIASVGLLQNPVLIDKPEGRFEVKAGERRIRALRMLRDEGKWDSPVHALVIPEGFSNLANLAENTAREKVAIWYEGRRYLELLEGGMYQTQIAQAVGKSVPSISYAKVIAEGIHPEMYPKLDRVDPSILTMRILRQMSRMRGAEGEPDFERQFQFLQNLTRMGKSHAPRRGVHCNQHIARRLKQLEAIPLVGRDRYVVRTVITFLKGQTKAFSL